MNGISQVAKEQLIADFRVVVAVAEELLRGTADLAGGKIPEVRAKE